MAGKNSSQVTIAPIYPKAYFKTTLRDTIETITFTTPVLSLDPGIYLLHMNTTNKSLQVAASVYKVNFLTPNKQLLYAVDYPINKITSLLQSYQLSLVVPNIATNITYSDPWD